MSYGKPFSQDPNPLSGESLAATPRIRRLDVIVMLMIGLHVFFILPLYVNRSRDKNGRFYSCQNNLRQFGIGFQIFSERDPQKRYCTGSFDLQRDGCPDTSSWVGNLIDLGAGTAGEMLCPTNDIRGVASLNSLIGYEQPPTVPVKQIYPYVSQTDFQRSFCQPFVLDFRLPDGSLQPNLGGNLLPGDPERISLVRTKVEEGFNTNYASSWFLVRGTIKRTGSSLPYYFPDSCSDSPEWSFQLHAAGDQRDLTGGYAGLSTKLLNKSSVSSNLIPLLADAAPVPVSEGVLCASLSKYSDLKPGDLLGRATSHGPVCLMDDLSLKSLSAATNSKNGSRKSVSQLIRSDLKNEENNYFLEYSIQLGNDQGKEYGIFLQDTSAWRAVHSSGKAKCMNVLMADSSVIYICDVNGDTYINPGFPIPVRRTPKMSTNQTPFADNLNEMKSQSIFVGALLDQEGLHFSSHQKRRNHP